MENFVDVAKNALSFLSEDLEENTHTLQRKIELLNSRKDDVQTELQDAAYHPRKKRKREVEDWLNNVENIIKEFGILKNEVQCSGILTRQKLSEQIELMTKEVTELLGQSDFPKGLFLEVEESISLLLLTTNHSGQAFVQNADEIWASLMDNSVLSIGIYGMAGVGKTLVAMHAHDKLLKESTFLGRVYWITVSQEFSIYKLQNDIAQVLKLDFSCENDERKRAAKLSQAFKKRERFVLILDDVRKQIDLEDIGISVGMNGWKLVITTRSEKVYQWMGCQRIIKVKALPHQEAFELFLKKLGKVELHPEVEEICQKMVKRCVGLPLAIVKLARSMRGVIDIREWRDALVGLAVMEDEVFPVLSYSYAQLRDKNLKSCFLRCSLYPENHPIPRHELIGSFISENLMGRNYRSLRAAIDQGHAILNQLERACLLERASTDRHVKMHDLIRGMAIWITKDNPRYMVKAGCSLGEIPEVQEWAEDLDKVSFMNNSIKEISSGMSPKCTGLSTLIFRQNPLNSIPDCFFVHMRDLQNLDLSNTGIQTLPESISDLENLRTLLLKYCKELESVPSLEKLKELRDLDLTGTSIEEVPQGMDSLSNLKFLHLRCPELKVLPTEILYRLSRLQGLSLPSHICVEVEALKNLEVLECRFNSIYDLNRLIKSQQLNRRLISYAIVLSSEERYEFDDDDDDVDTLLCKQISFRDDSLMESSLGEDENLLPRDIEKLYFRKSGLSSCLLDDFPILNGASNLKSCTIVIEDKIECIMRSSSAEEEQQSSGIPFESLQSLSLESLPNFFGLFMWKADAPFPLGTFSCLKELSIERCDKMKKLFPQSLVQNFHKLQRLTVSKCLRMEEIIEDDNNGGNSNSSNVDITFRLLEKLYLRDLPQLKSICKGMICCDSVEEIHLVGIKMIKKVPLLLPRFEGQPSPPPCLKSIRIAKGEEEWWDLLDWDCQNANSVLGHLVNYFDK